MAGDIGPRCCAHDASSHGQCPLPDGFFDEPELRKALARYDFAPVFKAIRRQTNLSQEEFGHLVGLLQHRVSAVERGRHRLRDAAVIARISTALRIPGGLLGFHPSPGGNVDGQEVSWMDRRDFLSTVAAITLGVGVHPEMERLEALLPSRSDPSPPRRIGAADVKTIEETTRSFRSFDFRSGGGLSRAAAVAQLDFVLKLGEAQCSDEIRSRLLIATSDLAGLAGWMTYDVEQHDAARRLWLIGLETARRSEHPASTDMIMLLHWRMAHQARHLDRPKEALRLAQLGAATAAAGAYPASAGARRESAVMLATCQAAVGNVDSCLQGLDQAEQLTGDIDPATAPPWAAYDVLPAALAGKLGGTYYELAKSNPAYAPAAVEQLTTAIDNFGPAYARSRALDLPHLAGSYFALGEVDLAVKAGHEGLKAIGTLSSKRVHARLRKVAAAAGPYSRKPDVADLREHIRKAVATVA